MTLYTTEWRLDLVCGAESYRHMLLLLQAENQVLSCKSFSALSYSFALVIHSPLPNYLLLFSGSQSLRCLENPSGLTAHFTHHLFSRLPVLCFLKINWFFFLFQKLFMWTSNAVFVLNIETIFLFHYCPSFPQSLHALLCLPVFLSL